MKQETLLKLEQLIKDSRFEFVDITGGLSIQYDLTDEELRELVEMEYGQTQQSAVELFTVMCKKLVTLALGEADGM